uniref:Uncharacterized protein n=1 Tax=Sinocyclocheilus grahami TaxID=75366 RepID=A0A672Q3A5_SINGR
MFPELNSILNSTPDSFKSVITSHYRLEVTYTMPLTLTDVLCTYRVTLSWCQDRRADASFLIHHHLSFYLRGK